MKPVEDSVTYAARMVTEVQKNYGHRNGEISLHRTDLVALLAQAFRDGQASQSDNPTKY